jgi:carotenoid cleavage dioxygenase
MPTRNLTNFIIVERLGATRRCQVVATWLQLFPRGNAMIVDYDKPRKADSDDLPEDSLDALKTQGSMARSAALTMMHDFALTPKHVIFMDLPIVFDLDIARNSKGDIAFRWDDNYGARLGVLRRDDPYGPIRWFDIAPCYVFHVANAYDRGNSIVLQAVRYPELWRDNDKWHTNRGFGTEGVMWRWAIDLDRGSVDEYQIDDQGLEFPRIDDRLAGLPARYAITVGSQDGVAPVPRRASLVRYDLDQGIAEEHLFDHDGTPGAPGEAVFVPAGPGADELAGWYLSYVYDPVRNGSDLVIIDPSNFAGKPVARVHLPQRVPHGFHGNWITD